MTMQFERQDEDRTESMSNQIKDRTESISNQIKEQIIIIFIVLGEYITRHSKNIFNNIYIYI